MLAFLPGQVKLPDHGFPGVNLGNQAISVELSWGPRVYRMHRCTCHRSCLPSPCAAAKHVICTRLVKSHSPFETEQEHGATLALALLSAHSRAGEGCLGNRGQESWSCSLPAGPLGFSWEKALGWDSSSTSWDDIRRPYNSCLCLHGDLENPVYI